MSGNWDEPQGNKAMSGSFERFIEKETARLIAKGTMSDTPRTDAQVALEHPVGVWSNSATISTDFARALERQLTHLSREHEAIAKVLCAAEGDDLSEVVQTIINQRDKAQTRNDELERELAEALKWKEEDPRMLRDQIRVADLAYNKLHERCIQFKAELAEAKRESAHYAEFRSECHRVATDLQTRNDELERELAEAKREMKECRALMSLTHTLEKKHREDVTLLTTQRDEALYGQLTAKDEANKRTLVWQQMAEELALFLRHKPTCYGDNDVCACGYDALLARFRELKGKK